MTQAGVATVMLWTSRLGFWHIWDTFVQQLSEAINHIMTSFCKFNICDGINRCCIMWKTLELRLAASRRSSAWIESFLSFQHVDRSHLQLAYFPCLCFFIQLSHIYIYIDLKWRTSPLSTSFWRVIHCRPCSAQHRCSRSWCYGLIRGLPCVPELLPSCTQLLQYRPGTVCSWVLALSGSWRLTAGRKQQYRSEPRDIETR